jgi:hypothetical protein
LYAHNIEESARTGLLILLIIFSLISMAFSYLLKTRIFEYGFLKESDTCGEEDAHPDPDSRLMVSYSDMHVDFLGISLVEAGLFILLLIFYFNVQFENLSLAIIELIILLGVYFSCSISLNRSLIKRSLCQTEDPLIQKKVFRYSIYLSAGYILIFIITSVLLSILIIKAC